MAGSARMPAYGYAPVRGAYFVHSGSTISAYEPVQLSNSSAEQDRYDTLAEIYGILVTLDSLEKSYMRDSVPDGEYTDACSRLLMQYRSFLGGGGAIKDDFGDLESFKSEWGFDCPRATERIRIGVPATMVGHSSMVAPQPQQFGGGGDGGGAIVGADGAAAGVNMSAGHSGVHTPVPAGASTATPPPGSLPGGLGSTTGSGGAASSSFPSAAAVGAGPGGGSGTGTGGAGGVGTATGPGAPSAPTTTTGPRSMSTNPTLVVAATENFITLLDAIQMGMMEKDVLHPLLRDLIQSVNQVTGEDFENKGKIVEWLIRLNRMRAAERLSEDESRQFGFDMRQAYDGFKGILS